MPALPLLRPREVVRAFERLRLADREATRQPYRTHETGCFRDTARGTLRTLIVKAGLTVDEFLAAAR
jgi:hypothetical protein